MKRSYQVLDNKVMEGDINFQGAPESPVVELTPAEAGVVGDSTASTVADVAESVKAKSGLAHINGTEEAKAKSAAIATAVTMDVEQVRWPHIAIDNGSVKTVSTKARIPGGALKHAFGAFSNSNPIRSTTLSASGKSDGTPVTLTLTSNEAAAAGFDRVAIPCIFVVISSKNDSATPGARLTVSVNGRSEAGGDLYSEAETITRNDSSKPMIITLFPCIKAQDSMMAQRAAYGLVNGDHLTFDVTVSGLFEDDIIQVTTPGYDSVEYQQLLKGMKCNLI